METAQVGLDVNMNAVKAHLAELPKEAAVQSKKMADEVDKQFVRVTTSAKTSAAQSAAAMAQATKGVESGLGRSKEVVSQLAAALSVVSPQAGAAVAQISALTGGLKAAASAAGMSGAAMLPLAPLLAATALAAAAYWQESKIAENETRNLGGSINGLSLSFADLPKLTDAGAASLARFDTISRDTNQALLILTGQLSALDAAIENRQRAISEAALPAATAAAVRLTSAQKELEIQKKRLEIAEYANKTADTDVFVSESALQSARDRVAAGELAVKSASEEMAALKASIRETKNKATEVVKLKDEEQRGNQAKRESTAATREAAAADREAAQALKEAMAQEAAARKELAVITEASYQATLSPMGELLRKQELELANVRALGMAARDRVGAEEALAAVQKRQAKEVAAATLKASQQTFEEEQRLADAAIDLRRRQQEAMTGVLGSALGGMADIADFAAKRFSDSGNEKAANKAFNAWKAFSYGAAVAQGIQAAIAAYASTAVIPVVGPVLAPAAASVALAATGLMVAKIRTTEMPTYHSGGTRLAPDEQLSVTRPNESWLTNTGTNMAGGPEGVRRMNQGQPSQSGGVLQMIWKHRIYGKFRASYDKVHPAKPAVRPGRRF